MAQEVPVTVQQLDFHGIYTAGNPIRRPKGTAAKCQDFRVMPDFWLRTRGGRKARVYTAAGTVLQIFPQRATGFPGQAKHLLQVYNSGTGVVDWYYIDIGTYTTTQLSNVGTSYDSAYARTHAAAATHLPNSALLYNGQGVRSSASYSPFYTWGADSKVRYFGLDAFCPSGVNPTVAFTSDGTKFNQVTSNPVKIWVGLHREGTAASAEHYGNAVYAGSIDVTSGRGEIVVSNLNRLTTSWVVNSVGGTNEYAELFYVFYATYEGGTVPYLIMDATLTGPYKVPISSTSASLSLIDPTANFFAENGWVLDPTREAPSDNFPPRPMRSIAFVNGRLYGVPMSAGSGSAVSQPGFDGIGRPDFTYIPTSDDLASVVFSKSAGDIASGTDDLGDPLQSWPLANVVRTPSNEQPLCVAPAMDDVRVLVLTATSTFLLEETADGLHEYKTVSRVHGISRPETLVTTDYGTIWTTQRNEIVMLPPGSLDIQVLSKPYQSAIDGNPRCADHVKDPINDIDRYQLWMDNGKSVCHDFRIGGEAYTCTNQDFTAARTCIDVNGKPHHLVAKQGIYSQEAQPDTGDIPTTDETYAVGGGSVTVAQISGEYVRNWESNGEVDVRQNLWEVILIGDGAKSTALSNVSPLSVEWYADFEEVKNANKKTMALTPDPQSVDSTGAIVIPDSQFRAMPTAAHKRWFKIVLKLAGHSSDDSSFAKHALPAVQGDLAKNFYGSILYLGLKKKVAEINRTL